MSADSIYEEFRDLLQEVPEAEKAIRDYRASRAKQTHATLVARARERAGQLEQVPQNLLRNQISAR